VGPDYQMTGFDPLITKRKPKHSSAVTSLTRRISSFERLSRPSSNLVDKNKQTGNLVTSLLRQPGQVYISNVLTTTWSQVPVYPPTPMVSLNHTQYDSRYVRSADGTEIYADACGDRSPGSPVLILLHGAFMVKGAFDPIIEDPKWTSSAFLVSLTVIRTGLKLMMVAGAV